MSEPGAPDHGLDTYFPGTLPAPSEWPEVSPFANTFYDPLIADPVRAAARAGMEALVVRHPIWGCLFFGGVISSVVSTLPGPDPWRHKHPLVTAPAVHQARFSPTPRFGSYLDAIDLTARVDEDPATDIGLVAFAENLGDDAARVLAAGNEGWSICATTLAGTTAPDGQFAFMIGTDALRWALARRRQYLGLDDTFGVLAMRKWCWIAARIAQGRLYDTSELVELVEEERLGDELYLPVEEF